MEFQPNERYDNIDLGLDGYYVDTTAYVDPDSPSDVIVECTDYLPRETYEETLVP